MRRTNKIILLGILIAILIIGIGYAAIQNITLNVSSSAQAIVDQGNFLVKFTGTPQVSDGNKVAAAITNDTNATINVSGLTTVGETVSATYNIQNVSSDLSADLTIKTTNSNKEYFKITSTLAKNTLTAGEATTTTVTVELIKTPIENSVSTSIGVQITAIPVQPGEEGTAIAQMMPKLMERESSDYVSGQGTIYYAIGAKRAGLTEYTADKIKTITLLDNNEVPTTDVVSSWDVSYTNGDGKVMAWLKTNQEDTTMYDLYIGGDGEIIAPENSSSLFGQYTSVRPAKGK